MRRAVPVLTVCFATQLAPMALGAETQIDPLDTENARAQAVASESAGDSSNYEPRHRFDTGYRFRFGIAFISGATLLDDGANVNSAPAVLGLDLRLGVQLDDLFAVMAQFSAAFLDVRASVLFEVTPTRYFSAGVGLGVNQIDVLAAFVGGGVAAVILPIRLAFNLPISAYEAKNRIAVSFAVNLMPGAITAGYPLDIGHRFEFAVIGGLGLEVY